MYEIVTTDDFDKQFKGLDKPIQQMVAKWIKKHLVGKDNPKAQGKPLSANLRGYWRYRIGDYRMIVEIREGELVVVAISIAHRSDVYR